MRNVIYISIILCISFVLNSCMRVTENRTIELNQIFDMKAKKWYKCEIGQDSTFFFRVLNVEDTRAYGSDCSFVFGTNIIVYFECKLNGQSKKFDLTMWGCESELPLTPESQIAPTFSDYVPIKVKMLKVYPISSKQDEKPKKIGLYDFKMVITKY